MRSTGSIVPGAEGYMKLAGLPGTTTSFVVVVQVAFSIPKDVVVAGNTPKWEKSVKNS
jgi:hypothetical protein